MPWKGRPRWKAGTPVGPKGSTVANRWKVDVVQETLITTTYLHRMRRVRYIFRLRSTSSQRVRDVSGAVFRAQRTLQPVLATSCHTCLLARMHYFRSFSHIPPLPPSPKVRSACAKDLKDRCSVFVAYFIACGHHPENVATA